MFCRNCGTQIKDESKFCPNCGAIFSENNGKKKKSNFILALIKVFLSSMFFMILMFTVSFWAYFEKDKNGVYGEGFIIQWLGLSIIIFVGLVPGAISIKKLIKDLVDEYSASKHYNYN